MLTGHKEHIFRTRRFQNLIHGVELLRAGKMRDVSRMKHELGSHRQRINLVDRRLQSRCDIRIRRLVEPHVAVADLNKTEIALPEPLSSGRVIESE